MTQRVFDVENEQDMQDLWSILPDDATIIRNLHEDYGEYRIECIIGDSHIDSYLLAINWHDKTEIHRPMQEATESDIGKLCKFWETDAYYFIGVLENISKETGKFNPKGLNVYWTHCRRLTKQEIEELFL